MTRVHHHDSRKDKIIGRSGDRHQLVQYVFVADSASSKWSQEAVGMMTEDSEETLYSFLGATFVISSMRSESSRHTDFRYSDIIVQDEYSFRSNQFRRQKPSKQGEASAAESIMRTRSLTCYSCYCVGCAPLSQLREVMAVPLLVRSRPESLDPRCPRMRMTRNRDKSAAAMWVASLSFRRRTRLQSICRCDWAAVAYD